MHLERLLRRLGLPFETEEDLRERGLPRTPDIHLLVPVGVTDQEGKVRERGCLTHLALR